MIKEDYVSLETAKLLKEKGFEGDINAYYHIWDNGRRVCSVQEFSHSEAPHLYIPAPILQMAMKWLREVHNLFIEISVDEMLRDKGYQWALYNNNTKEIMPYSGWGNTYEESCEAAIKYCLEKLI